MALSCTVFDIVYFEKIPQPLSPDQRSLSVIENVIENDAEFNTMRHIECTVQWVVYDFLFTFFDSHKTRKQRVKTQY